MPTIEYYLGVADELERRIISEYGKLVELKQTASMTEEFKTLSNKAMDFRAAKLAGLGVPTAKQAFAKACKSFDDISAKRAAG